MSRCDRVSFVQPKYRCDRAATATGRCAKHSEPMHAGAKAYGAAPTTAPPAEADHYTDESRPDWTKECEVCGQTPILPVTGMCGPCTFGEADTAGGNW